MTARQKSTVTTVHLQREVPFRQLLPVTHPSTKEKALARHDSLIRSIEAGKAPENINIVEIYQNRGHLLRCLHRYKEACAAYDRSMIVSDSLIKKEYGAQVDSLRQKHDVNTLLLEK